MPMPGIKTLKGIGRRKSGTPGLDDPSQTPVSSFRVIPRDENNRKSVGGILDKPLPAVSDQRRTWYEEDASSSNRGSGSSAATSARSRVFDRTSATVSSSSISQSPIEFSRKDHILTRAQTQGQLPTLGYLDLHKDDEDDDFGDLFRGLGDRRSIVVDKALTPSPTPLSVRTESEPFLTKPARSWGRSSKTPPPLKSDAPSPYSLKSRNSNDGLLASPSPDGSPEPEFSPQPPQKSKTLGHDLGFLSIGTKKNKGETSPTNFLRRMTSSESFLPSTAGEDADAKMVRNSVIAVRQSGRHAQSSGSPVSNADQVRKETSLRPPGASPDRSSSDISLKTPSMSSDSSLDASSRSSNMTSSNNTTPRAKKAEPAYDDDELLFDSSIVHAIRGVGSKKPFAQPTLTEEPKKVLTAAQFEDLKRRSAYELSKGLNVNDSDSGEEYEDDDEDENAAAEAKKRQAQKDAQHIIWRQKMAKDIGDHSAPLPSRPGNKRASQSTPNLMLNIPGLGLSAVSEAGSKSSEEDDIPLGILQAHNFPQRGKTPDPRLSQHSFIGTSSARPMSTMVAGPSQPDRTSRLPPFARKLPQDPYVSTTDLLNPSLREPMQFNRQSAIYPPPGVSPVPNMPPGGLVGVIAEEERQRGIRRGSPNPQVGGPLMPGMSMGMQGMPMNIAGLGQGVGSMGMGGGMPMMVPVQGNAEQNQINQQLLQVVQQQNMMMQAMMAQMQGQMGGMPMNAPGGYMNPQQPQSPGSMRPISMMSGPGQRNEPRTMSMVNPVRPVNQTRAMSMISTSSPFANTFQNWGNGAGSVRNMDMGPGPGYTPSVAPSERSNVGQPSRYRPVTNSHLGDTGSTITSLSTPQLLTTQTEPARKKKSGFFSAMIHPRGNKLAVEPTDEDEEDWSNFARKRLSVMPAKAS